MTCIIFSVYDKCVVKVAFGIRRFNRHDYFKQSDVQLIDTFYHRLRIHHVRLSARLVMGPNASSFRLIYCILDETIQNQYSFE